LEENEDGAMVIFRKMDRLYKWGKMELGGDSEKLCGDEIRQG